MHVRRAARVGDHHSAVVASGCVNVRPDQFPPTGIDEPEQPLHVAVSVDPRWRVRPRRPSPTSPGQGQAGPSAAHPRACAQVARHVTLPSRMSSVSKIPSPRTTARSSAWMRGTGRIATPVVNVDPGQGWPWRKAIVGVVESSVIPSPAIDANTVGAVAEPDGVYGHGPGSRRGGLALRRSAGRAARRDDQAIIVDRPTAPCWRSPATSA